MVDDGAMPESVPMPLPVELNFTPVGSVPVLVILPGVGGPTAATWKVPLIPWVKVVVTALVNSGAWSTVRVKLWVALGAIPLLAVIVMG